MDYKELKNKSENELHRVLAESREKLRDLRFKDASKQLKNVREIRIVRQTIARALMLLNKSNKKNSDKLPKKLSEQSGQVAEKKKK